MSWRMGGFGACGCCQCEDCCNGNDPEEFEVELTFADDYCGACSTHISGTYVLQRQAGEDGYASCTWGYDDGGLQHVCEPDEFSGYVGADYYHAIHIELRVRCVDETHYLVTLFVRLTMVAWPTDPTACNGGNGGSVTYTNAMNFSATVTRGSGDCAAWSSMSLDRAGDEDDCYCRHDISFGLCSTFLGFAPNICDWTTAAAMISAV